MEALTEREPVPRLPPAAKRRKLRESFGVTQDELASEMNVTTRTVRRWENGTDPTGENLTRYSQILARWNERARNRR